MLPHHQIPISLLNYVSFHQFCIRQYVLNSHRGCYGSFGRSMEPIGGYSPRLGCVDRRIHNRAGSFHLLQCFRSLTARPVELPSR
jgi:hypothetical protein